MFEVNVELAIVLFELDWMLIAALLVAAALVFETVLLELDER